jgi:hypothetical protein
MNGNDGADGVGFTSRGEWTDTGTPGEIAYNINDVVTYQGSSYVCIVATIIGNTTDPDGNLGTYWNLIAAKGDKGDTGDAGSTTITNNYPAFTNVLATINKTGGTIATPTAIDLTQFVNKLSSDNNGRYTLANGVEGQLMYLTQQGTGGIEVRVANARINGNLNTNEDLTFSAVNGNVITLLFIDGAWQQGGGEWAA